MITDNYVFEQSEYSSVSSGKKGVLRTVRGPLAEWDNTNRNNRLYSERLWDRVLESPYVKEQTKYKSLYGEANHPNGRYEVDFSRVSHSIVEMTKNVDKKRIEGVIDILDTPLGNILNTLYEYGSTLGFSSRAGGVLHKKKDHIVVDEDAYQFVTFDSVPYPSVAIARPVSEGAVIEDCDRAILPEKAHAKLKSIIDECTKHQKETLKQFIYELRGYDLDEELAILEGLEGEIGVTVAIEEKGKIDPIKETTLSLLKESYFLSSKLATENTNLRTKVDSVEEELQDKVKDLEVVESNLNTYKSSVAQFLGETVKQSKIIQSLNEEIDSMKNTISTLESSSVSRELFEEDTSEVVYLRNKIAVMEGIILDATRKVVESESGDKSEISEDINLSLAEIPNLIESLSDERLISSQLNEERSQLLEQVNSLKEENISLSSTLTQVTEEVSKLQPIVEENKRMGALVSAYKDECKSLKETYESSVSGYKDSLLKVVCNNYKMDKTLVRSKLKEDFTIDDIYLVCEGMTNKKSSYSTGKVYSENRPYVSEKIDESIVEDSDEVIKHNRLSTLVTSSRRNK